MEPNRCQSWILGLSGAIHTQTTVMDYLRQKIDSLTPTDTQDFESKLEKSHVFRMKGRQHGVILIKKQTTFIPQRRVLLKELTEWVPYFLRSFFICIIGEKFHFPLGPHSTYLVDGRAGGAYLPFGTLNHARAIFFKFLVLKGVWDGGGTILKSV